MHIEFLLEEESCSETIRSLLPRILGDQTTFVMHIFQGKRDLLDSLPSRLRGYRKWLPRDWRIVVLVDRDRDDCCDLKEMLEKTAKEAGLTTKTFVGSGNQFQVLNRIAIEELEAWFFGDVEAIVTAYPRVPKTLAEKRGFRDPDSIPGGTWEALENVLKKAGYYAAGMPKIEVARTISPHLNIDRNRSKSFCVFCEGLKRLE
jgi:hypothetical protein